MFLIPPKEAYMPLGPRDELLKFGDPANLKVGVLLKEKVSNNEKKIFSLYEMELMTKYINEQGNIVQRINDKEIKIKKRNIIVQPPQTAPMQVKQSHPINIPTDNSFHPGGIRIANSYTMKKTGDVMFRSHPDSLSTPESDGSFGDRSVASATPTDDVEFMNKIKTSPFFYIKPSWGYDKIETPVVSNNHLSELVAEILTPNIPGERVESVHEEVVLMKGIKAVPGVLYFTNYQLIFLPYRNGSEQIDLAKENHILVPFAAIARFEKVDRQNNHFLFGGENSYSIDIFTKDFRKSMRFALIPGKHIRHDICNHLSSCVFPNLSTVFAFNSKQPNIGDSWTCYDPFEEYKRLGITQGSFSLEERTSPSGSNFMRTVGRSSGSDRSSPTNIASSDTSLTTSNSAMTSPILSSASSNSDSSWSGGVSSVFPVKDSCGWRFTDQNVDYTLCDSYPKVLVVPDKLSSEDLHNIATFRTKSRIPILSWRDKNTGVSLTRCSQPRTGMSRTFRCKSDEKVISLIQATNPNSKKLHIIDARPLTNAMANMALGGGYENLSFYSDCELEFMNIANIHVVRDSWVKLRDFCESYSQSTESESINGNISGNIVGNLTGNSGASNTTVKVGSNWLSQLENTRWLDNISTILCASLRIVELLHIKKESVFVHCSDGWDRTPQISSLAQLLLDRYYRTIRGFCILIEKEWIHFGHKFSERLGFIVSNEGPEAYKDTNERSPVFLQFLDAVWQILQQFPDAFEFSEDLLMLIMDQSYSGRFGNFLFNTNKERDDSKLLSSTPSLWTYIFENSSMFQNPFYVNDFDNSVLYLQPDVKNLQLWKRYYMRYFTDKPNQYEDRLLVLGKKMRSHSEKLESEVQRLKREKEVMEERLQEMRDQLRNLKNEQEKQQSQSPENEKSETESPSISTGISINENYHQNGISSQHKMQIGKGNGGPRHHLLEDSDWEQL